MFKRSQTDSRTGIASMVAEEAANRCSGWRPRFVASGVHLGVSVALVASILLVVRVFWYPQPLDQISGIGPIVLLLMAVDVTLGPILTFVVFDQRKKTLRLDLAIIALLQLSALVYGVHIVEIGRPHFLVFVKDRFEIVSRADLDVSDLVSAVNNPASTSRLLGPSIVAAEMPTDAGEREKLMLESVVGGRDVQHFPAQYRALETQAAQMIARARSLTELRRLNPGRDRDIDAAVARTGLPIDQLGFLPLKGPRGDATVLVAMKEAHVVDIVDLVPWD